MKTVLRASLGENVKKVQDEAAIEGDLEETRSEEHTSELQSLV